MFLFACHFLLFSSVDTFPCNIKRFQVEVKKEKNINFSVYSYLILPLPRYPIFLKISFLTSCIWVFQEQFSSQRQETSTGYPLYLLLNSWQIWKVYRRVIHSKLLMKNDIFSKSFIWQDFLCLKDLHFRRIMSYIWQN